MQGDCWLDGGCPRSLDASVGGLPRHGAYDNSRTHIGAPTGNVPDNRSYFDAATIADLSTNAQATTND